MGAFGYGNFKGAKGGATPAFLDAEIRRAAGENQQQMQKNQARSSNILGASELGMEGYKAGMFGGDPASTVASTPPAPISTAVPIDPATGTAPMSEALLSSAASTAAPTGAIVGGGGAGGALATATEGASLAAGAAPAAATAAGGFGATAMAAMPYLAPIALALGMLK